MSAYTITADSGVTINSTSKTLVGAKREASAWMSFGGGSVWVLQAGEPVAMRRFWRDGNRFGWGRWESAK